MEYKINAKKIIDGSSKEERSLVIEWANYLDGKIVDFTAEAAQYIFDQGTEPSMFYGGFGKGLIE